MKIRLLKEGYKSDENFYNSFVANTVEEDDYISNDYAELNVKPFHIYFVAKNGKSSADVKTEFAKTIIEIEKTVIDSDRSVYMDERVWHSLFCTEWRDYLIDLYQEVLGSYKNFKNIIIKDFDWENYVYKSILIAQYVDDFRPNDKQVYYKLILDNIDLFNYIIKYEIFRNGQFLLNVMDIVSSNGISRLCKAKIKNHPELGTDERYGRRVIYEMNKSYPVVLCPMLSKDELEEYFFKYLAIYVDINDPDVISEYGIGAN